jgi:uncharacterized membrane protein YcaP (DUF421 family)
MKEILTVALHSVIAISTLFVLTRLMGKKQVAQLSFFDYTIGISIGSIAAQFAIDPRISVVSGLTGLFVFALFAVLMSVISMKSYIGRKLLDGTPAVLIEKGKIIEKALKKSQLNINDLLEECRQKDAFDVNEIEYAVLETNGRLSVLKKPEHKTLTPKDMQITPPYQGLCTDIIIDGKVIKEHLAKIQRDEKWLEAELGKRNLMNFRDVLLAYVDGAGELRVYLRYV